MILSKNQILTALSLVTLGLLSACGQNVSGTYQGTGTIDAGQLQSTVPSYLIGGNYPGVTGTNSINGANPTAQPARAASQAEQPESHAAKEDSFPVQSFATGKSDVVLILSQGDGDLVSGTFRDSSGTGSLSGKLANDQIRNITQVQNVVIKMNIPQPQSFYPQYNYGSYNGGYNAYGSYGNYGYGGNYGYNGGTYGYGNYGGGYPAGMNFMWNGQALTQEEYMRKMKAWFDSCISFVGTLNIPQPGKLTGLLANPTIDGMSCGGYKQFEANMIR